MPEYITLNVFSVNIHLVKEIILNTISLDDEILEKNGLNYGYKEIDETARRIKNGEL